MLNPELIRQLLARVARLERRVAQLETQDATRTAKTLRLVDGVAAPSNETGIAILFVDSSDGDLKVIFGDGTTAVIAADT